MSHKFMKTLLPVAALVSVMAVASPAAATDTTFAAYSSSTNGGFSATVVGSNVVLTEIEPVIFSFLNTTPAATISGVKANLTFTASGPASSYSDTAGFGMQSKLNGSFVFTSVAPYTIGTTTYASGSNLLTANFTNASLIGVVGFKTTTLVADTTNHSTVTYSSDFLNFSTGLTRDAADSLTAVAPQFGGTSSLNPFTGTPAGTFAQDPVPFSGVPEPTTWLMVLIGFGAIGLGIRRRAGGELRIA